MARRVCEKNGVAIFDTFTGFKFLAEKIGKLQEEGYTYLLAYEESYGYLMGDFCRDKDAVTASMMIAEMAAFYATKNMTLAQACLLYTSKTVLSLLKVREGLLAVRFIWMLYQLALR